MLRNGLQRQGTEMRHGRGIWCVAAALILMAGCLAAADAQDVPALYGPHGVSAEAVRQGILGSCFFHASIAAVANAAPDKVRSAITPNPGGGYNVHFSTGPDEVVFPEDVEFGRAHSYDHSEGMWVQVLMRAYAQRALRLGLVSAIQKSEMIPAFLKPIALSGLDQSGLLLVAYDRAVRSVVSQDGALDKATLKLKLADQVTALGVPSAEAQMVGGFLDDKGFFETLALTVQQNGEVFGAYKSLGQGGIPLSVIEALLGSAHAGLIKDRATTLAELRQVHRGGTAMVAGTGATSMLPAAPPKMTDWWVAVHSYTILDFDEAAQTVKLRNPWGARPAPDGVVTLPLATFLASFESFTYSGAPAS
jgi:hypothetical protein